MMCVQRFKVNNPGLGVMGGVREAVSREFESSMPHLKLRSREMEDVVPTYKAILILVHVATQEVRWADEEESGGSEEGVVADACWLAATDEASGGVIWYQRARGKRRGVIRVACGDWDGI